MFFDKFIPKLPSVKAEEEELEDPQQALRDKCRDTDHCQHLFEKYEKCNERVRSKKRTTEICTEELFDFIHALDHCVTPELFKKLK